MFALHLCFDGNFISDSYAVFEKYYPGLNLFLINKDLDRCRLIKEKEHFVSIPFVEKNFEQIYALCVEKGVDRVVMHGLGTGYAALLRFLCSRISLKVYWLFWGYELYIPLAQLGKHHLIDQAMSPFSLMSYIVPGKYNLWLRRVLGKRIFCDDLLAILPYITYFCFWNQEDYLLLQKHFSTSIRFKFFAYKALWQGEADLMEKKCDLPLKRHHSILINHQASLTGNHFTLMDRVALIDQENIYTKVVPLSYGSQYIRKQVLKKGKILFGDKFQPILDYMPSEQYFNLIATTEIALMGARRQEASGNIINLLGNGVKVFLREDNNLLEYYRKKGFIIFSFEKDLHSIEDLKPLSLDEQVHNRECRLKNRIYYEQFMPSFFEE